MAEIAFWKELLNDSGLSAKAPEYQRMVHAMKLAEFKLAGQTNARHLH
jgi:hypothetical protein